MIYFPMDGLFRILFRAAAAPAETPLLHGSNLDEIFFGAVFVLLMAVFLYFYFFDSDEEEEPTGDEGE